MSDTWFLDPFPFRLIHFYPSFSYSFNVQLSPTFHPPTSHFHSDSPLRQDKKHRSDRGRTFQMSCLHVFGHLQGGKRASIPSQQRPLWNQSGYVLPQPSGSCGGWLLVVLLSGMQAGVSGHSGSPTARMHRSCGLAQRPLSGS